MNLIQRIKNTMREEGIKGLFRKSVPFLYQQIWPFLPKGTNIEYNNVKLPQKHRITDEYLPKHVTQYVPKDIPDYEEQYLSALSTIIDSGDNVVLIGGGEGVSSIVAAKSVGPSGSVHTYEAAAEAADKAQTLVDFHELNNLVKITHSIVEVEGALRGNSKGADVVPIGEIPEADVLGIDADGAEFEMIKNIPQWATTLAVEHHPVIKQDTLSIEYQPKRIRRELQEKNFSISEEWIEQNRAYGKFPELVITAYRSE